MPSAHFGAALVAAGGWWIARRALSPVESITVTGERERAEQIKRRVLGVLGHGIVPPCLAHQTFRVGAVAARDHDARQREFALGR